MSAYAGVIPCAGASARMGQPKGLLEVDGRSFLRRTVDALSDGGCTPVLVIVAADEPHLTEEAARSGATVLINPDPGEGPITSLRIALEALAGTASGVAYLPVDHPMVQPETVRRLIAASRDSEASLTIPLHGGERGHPALFGAGLFPELLDRSLEGGARTVVHRHLEQALLLDVDDPGVLVDVDTPDVYRSIVAEAAAGADPGDGP